MTARLIQCINPLRIARSCSSSLRGLARLDGYQTVLGMQLRDERPSGGTSGVNAVLDKYCFVVVDYQDCVSLSTQSC